MAMWSSLPDENADDEFKMMMSIAGTPVTMVRKMKILGQIMTNDGSYGDDIENKSNAAQRSLYSDIRYLTCSKISIHTRIDLLWCLVGKCSHMAAKLGN